MGKWSGKKVYVYNIPSLPTMGTLGTPSGHSSCPTRTTLITLLFGFLIISGCLVLCGSVLLHSPRIWTWSIWAALTENHRLAAKRTNSYCSKFRRLESPRLRCGLTAFLGRVLVLVCRQLCSLCVLTSWWKLLPHASSCKGTVPAMRAPPPDLVTSQRSHLTIPSHWRLGFNI